MKEELVAGLRNALEHGASLEEARNSFLNAGYNRIEVESATREVSSGGGASKIISNYETPVQNEVPRETQVEKPIEKKKDGKKILLIGLIVLALIALLGAVGYLIYAIMS